jgi:hypothetical protein
LSEIYGRGMLFIVHWTSLRPFAGTGKYTLQAPVKFGETHREISISDFAADRGVIFGGAEPNAGAFRRIASGQSRFVARFA